MAMRGSVLALALVTAVVAGGVVLAPPAWRHWQIVAAADDPVALSERRLDAALDAGRVASEIDGALAARDPELAQSFVALATERGLSLSAEQRLRVALASEPSLMRSAEDFGHGFIAGDREGGAAFAGALAGDVVGFGDLRDLAGEGRKWLGGETADPTVLALAAAGLALSAATLASLGAALPARNGLSLVKSASKARALSPALTASLARTAVQAVDRPALSASLAAAARLDLAAARSAAAGIVRPAAMTRLGALGQSAGTLYTRTGQRGLRQVLAVAEDAGDVRRAAALASAKGGTTRATLKVLGRGALVLGAFSLTAMSWLFAFIGYALALAMLAQRLGWWLGRRIWPKPAAV